MDVDKLAIDLLLKGMTKEQQNAALDSIKESVTQAKAIQKQRIGENVQVVVQALKKLEADIKARYDETGRAIEKRVASIKDGKDGQNGVNGKDGRDGRPGRDGSTGPKGNDGLPGRNGIDGVDGVSVTNAFIDFDGSLIINLSNGQDLNVGEVVAPDLAEKIKVITNGGGTSQQVLDTLISLQTQINNLIPSQTGNAGKVLTTDGTDLSWDFVAGGLDYQGTWDASTNTPTLASGVGINGYYYITATAGSTNLDGITDWEIGDWLLFNGTVWQKIDQSNLVTSVNGQTGAVSLTTTNINEGTNLYYTDARARAAISAGTGISYDSATGVVTNSAPDQTVSLTGAGTTSISGTYPNFTITSADSTVGTVTSVSGTGTVSGISLSGTVTSSGNLTLGGTLDLSSPPTIGNTTPNTGRFTTLTVDDNTTFGTSNTDTVTFTARINSDFEPAIDNTYDLGRTGHEWRNLYIDGTANIDSLIADTADINAGTIDNTSIGASTASTGAFTTLSATGVTTVQAGTVSAPAITTTGDTNTGIFFPAADTIAFTEGGAEAMRITDAGKVGIGTSSPGENLSVIGQSRFFAATSSSFSRISAAEPQSTYLTNFRNVNVTYRPVDSTGTTFGVSNSNLGVLEFTNTSNSIIGTSGSSPLIFATSSAERMRITSAGNVGIGTSSPTTKAQISDATGGTTTGLSVVSPGNMLTIFGSNVSGFGAVLDATNGTVSSATGVPTIFRQGGLESMRIDSAGNVGIGTSSPTTALEVNGVGFINATGSTTGRFVIRNSTTGSASGGLDIDQIGVNATIFNDSNGYLRFGTNSTERMRITSAGNVGIGTSSPDCKLQVHAADGEVGGAIRYTATGVASGYMSADPNGLCLATDTAGITFRTGVTGNDPTDTGSERARIDSSGNLLVGTTTAAAGTAHQFQNASADLSLLVTKNSNFSARVPLGVHHTGTAGDNMFVQFYTEASLTGRGNIDYNRAVGLVRYNTTSDYRAKDIIGPLIDSGKVIDALKVYEGKMKGATQSRPMLIAHEAQEVVPYAVSGIKDEINENGTPKYQSMDVSSLVPLLLAEIQDLRKRLAAANI